MKNIKKLNLKINRLVDSLFVWNYKTFFKWRWLEFSDYRLYDENDDAKYIDFLASAREGKLLIKRFEEERELTVFFLLDVSESMNFWEEKTKIDTLIETFYILAYSSQKNNDKVWSLVFYENGYEFVKPGKWAKNIHRILEVINTSPLAPQVQPSPLTPLPWGRGEIMENQNFSINKLISTFNNLPIKNSLVFLLTDKMWEIEDKNLKILSLKNDVVYINIFDYLENNLVDDTSVLKIWNSIKTFFINLRDKEKISKYKKLRQEKIEIFKQKLNKLKISYLFIDDKTNIISTLFKFFKTR